MKRSQQGSKVAVVKRKGNIFKGFSMSFLGVFDGFSRGSLGRFPSSLAVSVLLVGFRGSCLCLLGVLLDPKTESERFFTWTLWL